MFIQEKDRRRDSEGELPKIILSSVGRILV
jgi:hypothetical protein